MPYNPLRIDFQLPQDPNALSSQDIFLTEQNFRYYDCLIADMIDQDNHTALRDLLYNNNFVRAFYGSYNFNINSGSILVYAALNNKKRCLGVLVELSKINFDESFLKTIFCDILSRSIEIAAEVNLIFFPERLKSVSKKSLDYKVAVSKVAPTASMSASSSRRSHVSVGAFSASSMSIFSSSSAPAAINSRQKKMEDDSLLQFSDSGLSKQLAAVRRY